VAGDRSGADLFIQVAPAGTALLVSDVDGTLTITETEEFIALLEGELPAAHSSAPEALAALAERGYLPLYLTARPEFLVGRTREFLAVNGFPPGLVHTTTDGIGAIGDDAAAFKTGDLGQALVARDYVAAYAFGNTATDAEAYEATGIQPLANRLFFAFDDGAHGGRRFDDYADLVGALGAAPPPCE
jgi:phosphatidate phosphatase PAH1